MNINGSPYHRGKNHDRETILRDRARQTGAWIVYVNAVGGQDELVFDGGSMMVAPDGSVKHRATMFNEDLLIVDVHGDISFADDRPAWPEGPEEVYRALVVGLRDYVRKNGFSDVVLGLSGGIDSAIVATLAVDALGADAVRALAMPSPYSSPESLEDAAGLRHPPRDPDRRRSRSTRRSTPTVTRSPRSSPARRRAWPRRTCRRGCAATC